MSRAGRGARSGGRPPRLAARLLAALVPSEYHEALLGDLAEEYEEHVRAVGRFRAGLWYWHQALGSMPPILGQRFRVAAGRIRSKGERELMSRTLQNFRYSLRAIRRNPGFASAVVLTLGLGIGANTLVFSAVDGVVLNPFPYPEPDRLLGVGVAFPKQGQELGFWEVLSPAEYLDIEERSRTLQRVVAWDMGHRQVTFGDVTENLFSAFWWGDAFPTLGVRAAAGRGFTTDEIESGARVAILSHRVWESRLGADADAVGRTILINGEPYTLVGVMPRRTLIYGTDLWIPMPIGPERFPRGRRQFQVIARMAPGLELRAVNAELAALARGVEAEYAAEFPEYEGWRLVARSWNDINVASLRPAALILLGAVGFVLLLVCANVASLLLARASARGRELAVRTALGAGRGSIVRQLLTESLVLGLIGGVLGVGLGYLGVRGLGGMLGSLALPIPGEIALNARVLAFSAVVSLLAVLAFGLVPAVQAARTRAGSTLRNEALSVTGSASRLRWQRAFVGIEVALALVLLVGSGLLVKSFLRLQAVDPGFEIENMLTMRLTLAGERYEREEIEPFFTELRRRVSSIPGVSSAATASQFPPGVFAARRVWIEGRDFEEEETLPRAYWTIASPEFFQTMRMPLKRGRALSGLDRRDSPFVAVINEEIADRYFPGEDPIGKRLKVGGPESDSPTFEIVGIVGNTRNRGLDAPPQPEIFFSSLQAAGLWNQLFLLIRTRADPRSVLPQVRAQVRALDPEQPVYAIRTVEEAFAQSEITRRMSTRVLTIFGVFALILAAVGIYGVVAYSATQRTREIGVRMALGAEGARVRRLMLRQALIPVGLGALIGLAAALALGGLMSGLLYEVSGSDPTTLAVTTLLLVTIALAASWLPALRASRIEPVRALRHD